MFRFSGPGLSEDYNAAVDEREKLMTLKAGNTVESMKPKEACTIPCNCAYEAPPCPVHGDQRNAPPNPELICPDIDECAPVLNAGQDDGSNVDKKLNKIVDFVKDSWKAPQVPEEIPPTNLWSLRWRINELEKRVDELTDRIALFNVRSGQKL